MVERWCAATPDEFTFDVKLHQLFSFHSTPAKLLPPDLQSRAETDVKGKVKPTRDLQEALLKVFLRATEIFRRPNARQNFPSLRSIALNVMNQTNIAI